VGLGYSLEQACRDLRIDRIDCSVLKGEFDQLISLGLIRSSKGRMFQTEKGRYILNLMKLEQKGADLREKARADLEEVCREIGNVDSSGENAYKWNAQVPEETYDEPALNKLPVRLVIDFFSGLLLISVFFNICLMFTPWKPIDLFAFMAGLVVGYHPGPRRFHVVVRQWYYKKTWFSRFESGGYMDKPSNILFVFFTCILGLIFAWIFYVLVSFGRPYLADPESGWFSMLLLGLAVGSTFKQIGWFIYLYRKEKNANAAVRK
jgi:hypothetical protein